jgi:hypothetical protein
MELYKQYPVIASLNHSAVNGISFGIRLVQVLGTLEKCPFSEYIIRLYSLWGFANRIENAYALVLIHPVIAMLNPVRIIRLFTSVVLIFTWHELGVNHSASVKYGLTKVEMCNLLKFRECKCFRCVLYGLHGSVTLMFI